jgi:hypothetical protein
MARGQAAGLRGNNSQADLNPVQRGAAVAQATTGEVRGVGQTRPNARGTQRAKPLQNLPGEERFSNLVDFIINFNLKNLLFYFIIII